MLWPGFVSAANPPAPAAIPVVTNISGAVSVRGHDGVSRDIASSRLIHSGDTLMTGVDSLALINLADIGSVRIGPTSTATASVAANNLVVNIFSGSACAQALSRGVSIAAGPLRFTAGDQTAIFSLIRSPKATTVAVYQGSMNATFKSANGSKLTTFKAGEAAISSGNDAPEKVALTSVQPSFTALKCPDVDVIARVMPTPAPSEAPSGGHGGGAGGILAALLGLGAIAAAAGHGGGGGGGGSTPTAPPSIAPGTLGANPSDIVLVQAGTKQSFTASESNYSGSIGATSNDTSIATVSPASGNGPSVTFTVTSVHAGATTITVTDDHGGSATVNVTAVGPLTTDKGSLTFSGTTTSQQFTAMDPGYTGAISAVSGNTGVATVAPVGSTTGPGPVTFAVAPIAEGNTTITVSDTAGGSTTVSVAVSTGGLVVNPKTLNFVLGNAPQTFTASEADYTGLIFATSVDPSVATVSPPSHQGPGPVTFTVSAVGFGSTTISVIDEHPKSAAVTVNVTGTPSLNPSSLSFTDVGAGNAQSSTASESGYTGTFSVVGDTCGGAGLANVGPVSGNSPSANVPVVARNTTASGGSCQFAVKDSFGNQSALANVTVGPFGAVTPDQSSLTFNDTGLDQNLRVTESGYSGTLTPSGCGGIVTFSPGSGPSGTNFTVTSVSGGSCNLIIKDDHTQSASVSVTVGGGQPIVPNPTSFTFTDVGAGAAAPLTVSENGYNGKFNIDESACAGIATVNPLSNKGNFTVTPVAEGGPCNLGITDNIGSTEVFVSVTVGPFGPVSPSSGNISLVSGGPNGPFTVSESGYTGNFNIDQSSCTSNGAASVSPGSGDKTTTFNVTPGSAGNCKIVVNDDHGQSANVDVFVTAGSLSVNPNTLQFPSGSAGATKTFVASDSSCGALDTISATAQGAPVASVSPSGAQPCFGTNVTFTVTAGPNGQGSVTVTDTVLPVNGSATVSVGVGISPLLKKHHPASVHKVAPSGPAVGQPHGVRPIGLPIIPGTPKMPIGGAHTPPVAQPLGPLSVSVTSLALVSAGPGQQILITEPSYMRLFTVTSSNPGVASVNVQSANGPTATLLISPRAAGNATIRINDDHGGVQVIQIMVRASGPRPLRLPGQRP